jgi:hypothetical protein
MKSPIYTKVAIGRIKEMQNDGATNKEIAEAIGTTEGSVTARISQLGLAKRAHVRFSAWIIEKCIPPRCYTPLQRPSQFEIEANAF